MNLDEMLADGKTPGVVTIEIGKAGSLTQEVLVTSVLKLLYVLQKVPLMTAVSICVGGYDEDERALCEIPEARRFILDFATAMDRLGIPSTRFLEDTVQLIKSCMVVELGKKVIWEKGLEPIEMVEEYRARVRQNTH